MKQHMLTHKIRDMPPSFEKGLSGPSGPPSEERDGSPDRRSSPEKMELKRSPPAHPPMPHAPIDMPPLPKRPSGKPDHLALANRFYRPLTRLREGRHR